MLFAIDAWYRCSVRGRCTAAVRTADGTSGHEILETDPVARRESAEFSAHALRSAGASLAPENEGISDIRVARVLLRESFVAAARAITGLSTLRTVADARTALEGRSDRPSRLTGQRWLELGRVLEDETVTTRAALQDAEATIAEMVQWALGNQRRRSRVPWLIAGALVLAVLVIAVPRLTASPPWADFTWKASSAAGGFPQAGTLVTLPSGLLFHTDLESGPWVLIDLLERRSVSRIVLRNRQDCCFERALPLIVETGDSPDSLSRVGRQTQVFDRWVVEFAEREARYVRVRAESTTYLHLSEVEIH